MERGCVMRLYLVDVCVKKSWLSGWILSVFGGLYFLHKQAAAAAATVAGSTTIAGADIHDAFNEVLKGRHNILTRKSGSLVEFHAVV